MDLADRRVKHDFRRSRNAAGIRSRPPKLSVTLHDKLSVRRHITAAAAQLSRVSEPSADGTRMAPGLLMLRPECSVTENPETAHLRYLDATHVRHSSGTFEGMTVCTEEDSKLGAVDGVLVDPATRRLRFFVVKTPALLRTRRFLLRADTPAILDENDGKLVVDAHAEDLERFDPRSVQQFSDDDVITAIFSQPAA
jgi:hypothetical protein